MNYVSHPNLITPRIKQAVASLSKKSGFTEILSTIWNYKITLLVFIVVVVYLLYRYKSYQEFKEMFDDDELVFDEIQDQVEDLSFDDQPHFNPSINVALQEPNSNTPPMPIKLPGEGIVMRSQIYQHPTEFEPLNKFNYDYSGVYTRPHNYYAGTVNPYTNTDPTIPNALGWPTNFNAVTNSFVNPMTQTNMQNMLDYQTILTNTNANIVDSMGPPTDNAYSA